MYPSILENQLVVFDVGPDDLYRDGRWRSKRRTNKIAGEALAMSAGRNATHGAVHIHRSIAAVHHDRPATEQGADFVHDGSDTREVFHHSGAGGVVQTSANGHGGESKFPECEVL